MNGSFELVSPADTFAVNVFGVQLLGEDLLLARKSLYIVKSSSKVPGAPAQSNMSDRNRVGRLRALKSLNLLSETILFFNPSWLRFNNFAVSLLPIPRLYTR